MKRTLRYFIENIKFSLLVFFIVSICGLLIFLMQSALEFITTAISTPILAIIATVLTLVIILSALMTVFDMITQ